MDRALGKILALAAWGGLEMGVLLLVNRTHFDGPPFLLVAATMALSAGLGWLWPTPWLSLAPVALLFPLVQLWWHLCGASCSDESTTDELYALATAFFVIPNMVAVFFGMGLRIAAVPRDRGG